MAPAHPAAALLSPVRSCGASLGTAAFGGLVFTLLHVQPGAAEGSALRADGIAPQALEHAFGVAYLAVAAVVAPGAWVATRVPRVSLTDWNGPAEGPP